MESGCCWNETGGCPRLLEAAGGLQPAVVGCWSVAECWEPAAVQLLFAVVAGVLRPLLWKLVDGSCG